MCSSRGIKHTLTRGFDHWQREQPLFLQADTACLGALSWLSPNLSLCAAVHGGPGRRPQWWRAGRLRGGQRLQNSDSQALLRGSLRPHPCWQLPAPALSFPQTALQLCSSLRPQDCPRPHPRTPTIPRTLVKGPGQAVGRAERGC